MVGVTYTFVIPFHNSYWRFSLNSKTKNTWWGNREIPHRGMIYC